MARILLAWEFGAGIGHLIRLKPIAEQLLERGHEVTLIVKDLRSCELLIKSNRIPRLQSPPPIPVSRRMSQVMTFAHVLHNLGFSDLLNLRARAQAWREAIQHVNPDLIVCEHSPAALLSARGLSLRKVVIGTGFSCPVASVPMTILRANPSVSTEELLTHERCLVETMNSVLGEFSGPCLESVASLYQEVDAEYLTTFRELDPYSNRVDGSYRGAWIDAGGKKVTWPEGDGPRVLAYLKPFPGVAQLLAHLVHRRWPTIVVGLSATYSNQFQVPGRQFFDCLVDMQDACATCDIAILNATHGSTVAALLAGKPVLMLPLFLEQVLTARRVSGIGAGRLAPVNQPVAMEQALDDLVESASYRNAAQTFAAKYAGYDPNRQIHEIVNHLDKLAVDRT